MWYQCIKTVTLINDNGPVVKSTGEPVVCFIEGKMYEGDLSYERINTIRFFDETRRQHLCHYDFLKEHFIKK